MKCMRALAMVLLLASACRGEEVKTDLYGDPLPPGAVARLGTIRLRHADADVIFLPDGKQLLSCGCDGEVRLWDAASGRLLRRKRLSWKRQTEKKIEKVFLAPDGATAGVWDLDTIHLFDTETGKERGRLPIDIGQPELVFSRDGKLLAVHGWNANRRHFTELWDVNRCVRDQYLETPPEVSIWKIAFEPEGQHIAGIAVGENEVHLWDAKTGNRINKKDRMKLLGACVAFSPDGKTLAVGSHRKGEVRLLEVSTRKEKAVLQAPENVKADSIDQLAFSPDGQRLAGAYSQDAFPPADHGLLIWDVTGAKSVRRIPEQRHIQFVFSPDGHTLLCQDEKRAEFRLWDAAWGKPLHRWLAHVGSVESLAIATDGRRIVSADRAGRLCLWDAATAKLLRLLQGWDDWNWLRGHSCHFLPDGRRMISASSRGTMQLWDADAGKELRRWQMDLPWRGFGSLDAVGISADGNRLAAIGWIDNAQAAQLFVWEIATGKRLQCRSYKREMRVRISLSESIPSLGRISDLAFAPDGERATVWLGDRVGLEETATGSRLAVLPKDIGGPIIFSPDGSLVAAAVLRPRKDPFEAIDHGNEVVGLSVIETATGEESLRLQTGAFHFLAFTPDSRGILLAGKKALHVRSTDTGDLLYRMVWPESVVDVCGEAKIHSLLPLPGGRLATGMSDGDILIWDLAASTWPIHPGKSDLDGKQLDTLWSDLAGSAAAAHRAIPKLAAASRQALPLLRDRLHPVQLDDKRIEQLLADLDSDSFSVRETASRELSRLRYRVEPRLRQALQGKPSLEMRRRIEAILTEPKRPPVEALRMLRAIAVLERIGTPETRAVLEKLSRGSPTPETQAAQAALQRLKRRK